MLRNFSRQGPKFTRCDSGSLQDAALPLQHEKQCLSVLAGSCQPSCTWSSLMGAGSQRISTQLSGSRRTVLVRCAHKLILLQLPRQRVLRVVLVAPPAAAPRACPRPALSHARETLQSASVGHHGRYRQHIDVEIGECRRECVSYVSRRRMRHTRTSSLAWYRDF
jgi:hypothetical protein